METVGVVLLLSALGLALWLAGSRGKNRDLRLTADDVFRQAAEADIHVLEFADELAELGMISTQVWIEVENRCEFKQLADDETV